MNDGVLKLLVCPKTKKPLKLLNPEILAMINQKIAQGSVKNSQGETIEETLEAGLITEAEDRVYPVRQNIPVMLIEESISLLSLK